METLNEVASLIAVVKLASILLRTLKTYYCGVRSARSDIKRLFSTVSSLELLLLQIEGITNNDHTTSLSELLKNPQGPLELISIELEAVRLAIVSPKKAKAGFGTLVKTLKWPLRSEDVMKTVGVIERHKSTLNSHLSFGMM